MVIDSQFLGNMLMGDLEEEEAGEFIQMITPDEEEDIKEANLPDELPILAVRNTVLFPGVLIPITVGRQKSIKVVKKAYKGDKTIGVLTQKNPAVDEPKVSDLYQVGTVARIVKMLVLPDGNTTIIIQGRHRFEVEEFTSVNPHLAARVKLLQESFPKKLNKEQSAVIQSIRDAAQRIMQLNPEIPKEAEVALNNIEKASFLVHFLSSNINSEVKDKQGLLEINGGMERATSLLEYMMKEVQMLELKQEIQSKVHSDIDQQQRDYFLRQQMKVLQDELGEEGPEREVELLRQKGKEKKWSDKVNQHFNKELDKVLRMNPMAAEYPIAMNYAELMVDLPWGDYTQDDLNLKKAKKILDDDHFGLEKVKDRILEYLAVLKLKNDLKGPILCLYGPPGVGKTSLGKSIAKALGRQYVRMSLGGVHDEAEIRGHRKTYVGAMPGKVIQNLKKAKSSNPVFVLDEIDKVNSNFRGDPSSALLEVLDPEQNSEFVDNYLEVEYDLSKVLFIATANSLDTIQPALRDRMEIIEVTGYTLEEKIEIAKRHLIPKQKQEHGWKPKDVSFDKKAIQKLIDGYTRESGVRNLERKVGSIVRSVAKSIALEEEYPQKIDETFIEKVLGGQTFDKEMYSNNKMAGVVTGLAWTAVGGEILFIESSLSKGKGKLTLSGQLGDVMKESAITAISYLKSNAETYGIDHKVFEQYDLHIHVPAGAVPKDGPSAGITMLTAITSLFTQRKVRNKLAMTGEITLRGNVLPVGGIKEKILAARRAGIKEIVLSKRNQKDIAEINERYIKGLSIHYVENAAEVLELALLDSKVAHAMDLVVEVQN